MRADTAVNSVSADWKGLAKGAVCPKCGVELKGKGKKKRKLETYGGQAVEGMRYIHIPELGIPSAMRKGLGESVSHKTLFKAYESKLLPKQEIEIKQLIDLTNQNKRIALVCFEADHLFCHRHSLVEYLQKNKAFKRAVIHL